MPSVLHRHLAQAPSRATRRCLSSLAKAAQPSPGGSSVMQSPRPRSRLPNWNLCSYRGQVAPRTVYRRAGNAVEDVAEMARWRDGAAALGTPGRLAPLRADAVPGRSPAARTRSRACARACSSSTERDSQKVDVTQTLTVSRVDKHTGPRAGRSTLQSQTRCGRAGPVSVTLAMKRQATDREEITAKHTR